VRFYAVVRQFRLQAPPWAALATCLYVSPGAASTRFLQTGPGRVLSFLELGFFGISFKFFSGINRGEVIFTPEKRVIH
ncbi:hypothetical protein, partial [Pseudomonas piscis]|uniref:hypothetical protein n=1 Tax=Pseudomonas piscis TaxID=2614538 RepID=UPI001F377F86